MAGRWRLGLGNCICKGPGFGFHLGDIERLASFNGLAVQDRMADLVLGDARPLLNFEVGRDEQEPLAQALGQRARWPLRLDGGYK